MRVQLTAPPTAIADGCGVGDVVRRVWKQSDEDNVFFLAGGLAFNVLLALVPFVLLLHRRLWLLWQSPERGRATVTWPAAGVPAHDAATATELLQLLVTDVVRTRGASGSYAAIAFVWFSTRLFGSLRSVLALIFDGADRGIVAGKLFDLLRHVLATLSWSTSPCRPISLSPPRAARAAGHVGLRETRWGA